MTESHEQEATLAERLFAENVARQTFRPIRGPERPASLEGGYRVQALVNRRYTDAGRGAPAGYKVGLTSQAIQEMCNTDQPVSGVVFSSTVRRSPAQVALADFVHLGIEFELAVELGSAFRPGDAPFTLEDARARVAACMPAFELVEDRGADYADLDVLSCIMDNGWCGGIVLGERRTDWQALDLAATPASLTLNDGPPEPAVTGAAMGNPLNSLVWLANQRAAIGEALEAGTVVMTGSTLATRFPRAGDRFVYEIEGLGAAEAVIV